MIRHSYFETNDLSLAAALAAVGIPFSEETPFVKTKTVNGETYKFFFQEGSPCGTYRTGFLVGAWNDEQFHLNNPEHPFAYIKCAFNNRNGLLDVVKKSQDLVVIERNGKIAIISKNASDDLKEKIFSQM